MTRAQPRATGILVNYAGGDVAGALERRPIRKVRRAIGGVRAAREILKTV